MRKEEIVCEYCGKKIGEVDFVRYKTKWFGYVCWECNLRIRKCLGVDENEEE